MIHYWLCALRAQLRARPLLFALSVFGVALGVASVLGIQILNQNALGAFAGSMRAVSGEADLTVLPAGEALDERLFPEVLAVASVARAWPTLRLDVALDAPPGERPMTLDLLGLDLFAAREIRFEGELADPGSVLTVPGWTAISPQLAGELGAAPGTPLAVTLGTRRARLRVGALVDFRRGAPLASSRLAVMDIAQAQSLFGQRGTIHQIDVVLREGADPERARARIQRRLGPGVRVRTPRERSAEAAGISSAFRLNLTALSLVSLFVGGFLIYVSTQASLLRRRAELGLLRALGATRGQALGLILAEVALVGLLGTGIGVPLGAAAAFANVDVVSGTLTSLYLLEAIDTVQLSPGLIALGVGTGIGGALAGGAIPAFEMVRRHPRSLLSSVSFEESARGAAGRAFAIGLALLAAVAAGVAAIGERWRPGGFALAFALLAALALSAPLCVQQCTRWIHSERFGLRYGVKALGVRLSAPAFSVAALAIAISMLVAITVMVGSFRRTVDLWIGDTLSADVYVSTPSWSRGRGAAVLTPELIEALRAEPGVRAVDRLRQLFAYTGERRISLEGVDMALGAVHADVDGRFALAEGDRAEALRAVRERGAVLISEPLARKERLGVGDGLELSGPDGTLRFPVAGVTYDYASELGSVTMDLRTLEHAFGPGPVHGAALYLEPGLRARELADALARQFSGVPLRIRSNAELRERALAIFDQTFAITRLLQGMSLLIAASGIALTLVVLARERASEIALYRAIGARRTQIATVFLGKGLGIALFGGALGVVGGVALAMILIFVVNRAYFGWTIALHWPWIELVQQAGTIALAAAAASAVPALRASRTPAGELSRETE